MDQPSSSSSSSSSPPGHALGGDAAGPLTPDEMRRRRLANIEKTSTTTTPIPIPTTPSPTPTPRAKKAKSRAPQSPPPKSPQHRHPQPHQHQHQQQQQQQQPMDADDDDGELQMALALSMSAAGDAMTNHTTANNDQDDEETPEKQLAAALRLSLQKEEGHATAKVAMDAVMSTRSSNDNNNNNNIDSSSLSLSPRVQAWYDTPEACKILDFHYIMWDLGITTEQDQRRWLSQGIHFKTNDEQDSDYTYAKDSLLAAVISNYGIWGLTQAHGGPCGVLASVQAELMRLLLFGPRTPQPPPPNNGGTTSTTSTITTSTSTLQFPTTLTNHFVLAPPDLSPQFLRQALALSISMILARAAMTPSATLNDQQPPDHSSSSSSSNNQHHHHHHHDVDVHPPTVKLVLPKATIVHRTNSNSHLEWHHLEPWSWEGDSGGSGHSEHLLTYTITLQDQHQQQEATAATTSTHTHTHTHIKRQKRELDVEELAHATAQFLLETKALDWFQRPGGVLLLMMSLATSRGIPNVQGDMDDPTAKLTSNFGHCSQELINLLLTGQAVSNVFDNTLRPSGELICRGIQSRPTIGYLSQLESMRYVEVGGYYKTPQFPIWVVGSTSHFTVMFGDAACLQESTSDVLLEKVRRAFKQMDGGEENGFIQIQQLDTFLKALDLDIPEHGVQTFAATMEVHGAGIILWEDLWKRVSRLMTGATLESVLEWTDPPPSTTPQPIMAAAAAPAAVNKQESNISTLSDEELARKLQAEWNGEVVEQVPAPVPAAASNTNNNSSNGQRETFGHTFQMYHYNGLRGGALKPFRVTRLSADEAIGASVSLGASSHSSAQTSGSSGDLEDVIRTKWASCKVHWLGGPPPSIN